MAKASPKEPDDMKDSPPKDVEAYLAAIPSEARTMLEEMRRIILAVAPDAAESISYGVPTFKLLGRPLVYIGAAKKHCALYAITTSVQGGFKNELEAYDTSKGTIRFPIGKPLPTVLIEALVKARVAEHEASVKR